MYKNWKAICQIVDPYFRLVVALSSDNSMLKKLKTVFPELFTEEKPEHEGPFPLSVLRILDHHREEYVDNSVTNDRLEKIGFPAILCAADTDNFTGALPMPVNMRGDIYDEWLDWLRDHEQGFPRQLRTVRVDGTEYYLGWAEEAPGEGEGGENCYLYPCVLVDVNA